MARKEFDDDLDEDFEAKYDALWGEPKKGKSKDADRDAITGRQNKRPKMAILNKAKVSKRDLDDLFLEN